jgi:DNA-binding transcriptional ArsR family regulator
MSRSPNIAALAALIGDPARASMLNALMGGQALAAGELAELAGVTGATASGHLAQLLNGQLLAVEKQGRHRYYRLAGADVAAAIEALMDLAQHSARRQARPDPKDIEMRKARVCYDHLAGERGVELFVRLSARNIIELQDGAIRVTASGERALSAFGIDVAALKAAKRPLLQDVSRLERAAIPPCWRPRCRPALPFL